MATCYLCGKSHAEYRREVKTGNSYRTGISSRGRTSYSTQSHYGPRCVCAECALQIDYNNQKSSRGALVFNIFGTMVIGISWLFLFIFGLKGLIICGVTSAVCFISAAVCKYNKAAEADKWYEANKGQYIDNIDLKEITAASQKFGKILEKGLNTLLTKIFRFKDSANKCLVTSKNPNDFKSFYEDCNSVIAYIDSFINQTQEELKKFNENILQQYGSKDIINKALNECNSSWNSVIDTLIKEKTEIQQLQKKFDLSNDLSFNSSTTSVSNNVPLGYKTADVFDTNFWNKEFWKNITVEQIQKSSSQGVNNKLPNGSNALNLAIEYNKNPKILQALIEKGCDVNNVDNYGFTIPMHLMEEKNYNLESLREILKSKFDLSYKDKNGNTTLIHALLSCPKFEIIKTLIEFGADVNESNNNNTPIEIVANNKDISIDIMRLLLNTGVQKLENVGKNSPLTYAVSIPNNTDKIKLLIDFGYDVNLVINDQNATSLFAACLIHNNQNNINMLLDNSANINQQIDGSRTCLLESIIQQYPENAKVLIERGADINICDNEGISPLFAAAFMGDVENLKLLISKKADPNQLVKQGYSPLSQCFKSENANEIFDILIRAGANFNYKDAEGNNILSFALNYDKDIKLINKIIDLGVNLNEININGESPLIIALQYESHPDVISLLLDKGADRNIKDKNGNTTMQLALKNPNSEIVKIFMN